MRLSSIKKRLGDILVDVGVISPEQLKEALAFQERNGGKLGTILAQMGIINEEVMLAFLGKQCGVSYVSLAEYGAIPPEVIQAVPESIIRYQNLIPIAREGATLTVAMADPFNIFAVDDIKVMTGCDVQVVIASESEIKAAIAKYYTHQPDMETTLLSLPASGAASPKKTIEHELLAALLMQALKSKAESVYLEPHTNLVRYRIDGILYEQAFISAELMGMLRSQLRSSAGIPAEQILPWNKQINFPLGGQALSLRVGSQATVSGERLIIQLSAQAFNPPVLEKMGIEPEALSLIKKSLEQNRGAIIICGPQESGKTSTLYAIASYLNRPDRNIVAVEDDISCILSGIAQIPLRHLHDITVAAALESALCEKTDALLIDTGALNDLAREAFLAAARGIPVVMTVSAESPSRAVEILLNAGVPPYALASYLRLFINQRLVRTLCPHCKEEYGISRNALLRDADPREDKLTLWKAKGCAHCGFTGHLGRSVLADTFETDGMIRESFSGEQTPRIVTPLSGIPSRLPSLLLDKLTAGVTSAEEYLRIIKDI